MRCFNAFDASFEIFGFSNSILLSFVLLCLSLAFLKIVFWFLQFLFDATNILKNNTCFSDFLLFFSFNLIFYFLKLLVFSFVFFCAVEILCFFLL